MLARSRISCAQAASSRSLADLPVQALPVVERDLVVPVVEVGQDAAHDPGVAGVADAREEGDRLGQPRGRLGAVRPLGEHREARARRAARRVEIGHDHVVEQHVVQPLRAELRDGQVRVRVEHRDLAQALVELTLEASSEVTSPAQNAGVSCPPASQCGANARVTSVTSMSAFLGRISDSVELLRGRSVGAEAGGFLRELRLELGELALEALDVLLGALDVVALLDDPARPTRGPVVIEPADGDLRPRKPPRIEPATETAACRPAPRSWFSSRSTACCGACAASTAAPRPWPRTSRAARRLSSRDPRAHPARAGRGNRPRTRPSARRASATGCARAAPSGSGRASRRSPSTSAGSPWRRVPVPAARGTRRPRAASTRDRPARWRDRCRPPSRSRSGPSAKAASRAFSIA